MEWKNDKNCVIFALTFCFLFTKCFSAATFISDRVLDSQRSTGRNLLQLSKPCPIDFEFQNYTIITSQCRGPKFPAEICCLAFKEFACPFTDQLNDLSNNCATIMFSYIYVHEKYPPGLFASECKDSKRGVECSNLPGQVAESNYSQIICKPFPIFMLVVPFLVLFLALI